MPRSSSSARAASSPARPSSGSTARSAPCASTRGPAKSSGSSSPASSWPAAGREAPAMSEMAATAASAAYTAHVDTFCRDHLPPPELFPDLDLSSLPELAYPPRLNCAVELLDRAVERGWGDRIACRFPGGRWTYGELLATANRIAHVLVEDLGVVPGNRVLLRGPNAPLLAACWLAVLKAGGVVACTMPLLRVRGLTPIADQAER